MKCPLCNGNGTVEPKSQTGVEERVRQAKALRKDGYSIRQIQRALGYKSPNAAAYLLTKKIIKV